MKIFLVAGKAGTGKDEIAKVIKGYFDSQNKKAIITGFSKYLKMYAKEIIGWQETEEKPRKFLQDLGVTIKENMNKPLFLINRIIDDIGVYSLYYDIVILNDVRLPLEIEEMKRNFSDVYSFYVINQFAKSKLTIEEQTHITETALEYYDNFDLTVVNDDLNNAKMKVENFLRTKGL